MVFDTSVFENVQLALVVPLGTPLKSTLNLVIFFTEPGDINWAMVKNLVKNPGEVVVCKELSASPWSYRCCDYTVGPLLSLIEIVTKKTFREMPSVENVGVRCRYLELV